MKMRIQQPLSSMLLKFPDYCGTASRSVISLKTQCHTNRMSISTIQCTIANINACGLVKGKRSNVRLAYSLLYYKRHRYIDFCVTDYFRCGYGNVNGEYEYSMASRICYSRGVMRRGWCNRCYCSVCTFFNYRSYIHIIMA